MKNSDIAILKKVLLALEKYLPSNEKALFDEYSSVFERFNAKNEKEKQAYQDKSEYHRGYTRSWQKNNPEKRKEYDNRYLNKKREAKRSAKENTDKIPSLLEELEKNQALVQSQTDNTCKPPKEVSKDNL